MQELRITLTGIAVVLLLWQYFSVANCAWMVGLWVFAVLEHINYFEYQLMHDTKNDWAYLVRNKRLKRAILSRDLSSERLRRS